MVRNEMQILNKMEFMGVPEKVKQLRKDVKEKQKLYRWSHIKESIYRQKSIIKWLQQGDANTAFFFASMKGRRL